MQSPIYELLDLPKDDEIIEEIELSSELRRKLAIAFYYAEEAFLNDNDFFVQNGCKDRDFMAGYCRAIRDFGDLMNPQLGHSIKKFIDDNELR